MFCGFGQEVYDYWFLSKVAVLPDSQSLEIILRLEEIDLKERKLNRLTGFDYSNGGYYFVTICTENRINYLGNIVDGQMMLNAYGQIVEQQWIWLQKQYKYVQLDAYIIMPNHIHGIVIIDNVVVGNSRDHSLQEKTKIKSLSELIGAFKTTSSKLIHETGLKYFQWQKSFYDHIIRNERSLFRIQEYIRNNPAKWELDRDYI